MKTNQDLIVALGLVKLKASQSRSFRNRHSTGRTQELTLVVQERTLRPRRHKFPGETKVGPESANSTLDPFLGE